MISADQVKELRDKTSVSVMQCRKALEEADGDMEKALIILRKKGSEIAEKKSDRTASDGKIMVKQEGGRALVLTLFCETDFVAQNERFVALAQSILDEAWTDGIETAKANAAAKINDVVLAIGENIQLGSIDEFAGEVIGSYTHFNGKQAALVVLTGGDEALAKDIAMHATAMKPKYLSAADIKEEDKEAVLGVIQKEIDESDKPAEIKEKMLTGKLDTYFKEQTLVDQLFFKDGNTTVGKLATSKGATIVSYKLYMLG
jgi:elongation factor Ts